MSSPQSRFDVFLCHNGQDKPEVKKIALELRERGLRPWLDESELRPGHSWQELLEEQIEEIHSAAVFVGSSGIGPWQEREMRAFLSEFVDRRCPVIPVLLANASQEPKLPIFLKAMTWVDFRRVDPAPMERLVWGITGEKPTFFMQSNDVSVQLTAQEFFDRGRVKIDLGDKQGAIADFNQAIKLNPDDADTYVGRGLVKDDLGDKQGAIADLNQAIKLKPDYAIVYMGRGNIKDDLGDKQGAIADYNQAIKLNPDYANAYNNRGNVKDNLGDKRGAIADYNQAIKLNPDDANPYYNRGNAKKALGDKQGALSDFQTAAKLFQQQGNTEWYQNARDRIQELQK